jgi:hypothetical protein
MQAVNMTEQPAYKWGILQAGAEGEKYNFGAEVDARAEEIPSDKPRAT